MFELNIIKPLLISTAFIERECYSETTLPGTMLPAHHLLVKPHRHIHRKRAMRHDRYRPSPEGNQLLDVAFTDPIRMSVPTRNAYATVDQVPYHKLVGFMVDR